MGRGGTHPPSPSHFPLLLFFLFISFFWTHRPADSASIRAYGAVSPRSRRERCAQVVPVFRRHASRLGARKSHPRALRPRCPGTHPARARFIDNAGAEHALRHPPRLSPRPDRELQRCRAVLAVLAAVLGSGPLLRAAYAQRAQPRPLRASHDLLGCPHRADPTAPIPAHAGRSAPAHSRLAPRRARYPAKYPSN
ncbi:hypothetical protein DFH06DRAFT_1335462 [Mycena polygramma]|nr:hypothetical protein DFH06DRAFT_1335462 [Mycena polygramma]